MTVKLTRATRSRLLTLAATTVVAAASGLAYTYVLGRMEVFEWSASRGWVGLLTGLVIGALTGGVEYFWFQARAGADLRRRPFWAALAVRAAVHTGLVVIGIFAVRAVFLLVEPGDDGCGGRRHGAVV